MAPVRRPKNGLLDEGSGAATVDASNGSCSGTVDPESAPQLAE
jgi:hypothetical protein